MQDEDIYYDGLLKIVSIYRDNKETVRQMLKTFDVPVSILSQVYLYLIRQKEAIEPIESLPVEEKNKLWAEANKFKPKNKRQQYCEAVYLLNII